MPTRPMEAFRGSLDLLVLKTLSLAPHHGWGISQRVQQMSGGEFEVNQGSLYPALHRLEERGWIAAEWGVSDTNRQAKFYRLTRKGERELAREAATWAEVSLAVSRILDTSS